MFHSCSQIYEIYQKIHEMDKNQVEMYAKYDIDQAALYAKYDIDHAEHLLLRERITVLEREIQDLKHNQALLGMLGLFNICIYLLF